MTDNDLEPRRLFLEQFYSGYIVGREEAHRAQRKMVADAAVGYAWPYPVFTPYRDASQAQGAAREGDPSVDQGAGPAVKTPA
jgi:hypothetical protein